MTTKFYYQTYDNAAHNTVNAQALYAQYPPTYEETERKWKMKLFKSRKCRNASNVRKILGWSLPQEEFEQLRYKAVTFPAVYDKWGFFRNTIRTGNLYSS
jgi:hypothetical protein|tara:strand:+ start:111 stop:410 length:300 start_codon:yes stop_codon:yes gene_type:complete